jgi:cysteinyl-tRNA synthetase
MAEKLLGPAFEIHGGGLDLRFPHHENELAQSRGAGREFARLWAHNGMLELAQEKMSKSLGNIVSLREVLESYGAQALLVFFLSGHYRSPLEYSDVAMEAAAKQAEDFRTAYRVVPSDAAVPDWNEFAAALEDDFNTPLALSYMHRWRAAGRRDLLGRAAGIFGLRMDVVIEPSPGRMRLTGSPPTVVISNEPPAEIRQLAEARQNARAAGDYDRADALRAEIDDLGWEVQDVPDGFRLIPKA